MNEILTDEELAMVQTVCDAATPGPWYWQHGKHTGEWKDRDAGGLHTKAKVFIDVPGKGYQENNNVIFPTVIVDGDPYWLDKFRANKDRNPPPLRLALEFIGKLEDLAFTAEARTYLPRALATIRYWKSRAEAAENP